MVILCMDLFTLIRPLIGPMWDCYIVDEVIKVEKYLLQQENKTNNEKLSGTQTHSDLTFANTDTDIDIEPNFGCMMHHISCIMHHTS